MSLCHSAFNTGGKCFSREGDWPQGKAQHGVSLFPFVRGLDSSGLDPTVTAGPNGNLCGESCRLGG